MKVSGCAFKCPVPHAHQVCGRADHARLVQLGKRHGAPLEAEARRLEVDAEASAVKSAARALNGPHVARLPVERRQQLEAQVCVCVRA